MARTRHHLVILDFEATCDADSPPESQEIIEFPSVLYDVEADRIVDEFCSFVRPVHHPVLSEFCRGLTGIGQDDVDGASAFPAVFATHQTWMGDHGLSIEDATATGIWPRCCPTSWSSSIQLRRRPLRTGLGSTSGRRTDPGRPRVLASPTPAEATRTR